jgi:hypothetical protein
LLAEVPKSWRGIRDIQVDQNGLVIIGTGAGETVTIDARGIPEWKR